jgi:ABC-type multidrug transport system fused ATPase/permease subunit
MRTAHSNQKPAKTTSGARENLMRRLWLHIQPRRRIQFGLLIGLMFIASLAELASIGAVLPFLGVLTAPERVYELAIAQPFIRFFNIQSPQALLIPLTGFFAIAALAAGAIRVLLLWVSTRLSFVTGADLGLEIYRRTLYQPYSVHISRNSSAVIDAVSSKLQVVISGVIYPVVLMTSSTLMLLIVVGALVSYQPIITLLSFTSFGAIYLLISRLTRVRLQANSQAVAIHATRRIKALQEGMGGIRDLLLDGTQSTYCAAFSEADQKMRRAQAQNSVFGQGPRYLIEALGMVLIALMALWLTTQPGGIDSALPVMGALALAAQKLLPMLQQLYQGWSSFKGHRESLLEVLDLLDQPLPTHLQHPSPQPIAFANDIQLEAVSFRYRADTPWILQDVSVCIPKGSRVGIVGITGGGKSTLLDILMGLLSPSHGKLCIDGSPVTDLNCRAWQSHIANVPQVIYLADASVAENIAFGVPQTQIDLTRVEQAATLAQIAETISSWPEGYSTLVGERGVQLSGGQRQRIGIARAHYKEADVIVLDEATNALDAITEEAVMEAFNSLDSEITLFIIAHRLSTLRNCDFIIEVKNGHIYTKSVEVLG